MLNVFGLLALNTYGSTKQQLQRAVLEPPLLIMLFIVFVIVLVPANVALYIAEKTSKNMILN